MWERVSLKIPAGWEVVINNFYYIPLSEIEKCEKEEDKKTEYCLFLQDLLYIRKIKRRGQIVIKLGWYPERETWGEYYLQVIKDENWHQPSHEYKSRNIDDVIKKINFFLEKYTIMI